MGVLDPFAQLLRQATNVVQPAAVEQVPVTGTRREMAQLLARSLVSNTASAREEFHLSLLGRLLPDEARIIAALAVGEPSPMVSVLRRAGGEPVLEHASLIGRTAAVTLPSLTTRYVAHLMRLGLVEAGPEDPDNAYGYELVLAERDVRAALKAGELGKVPARVVRRTLRLSALGRDFWEACRPDEGVEA